MVLNATSAGVGRKNRSFLCMCIKNCITIIKINIVFVVVVLMLQSHQVIVIVTSFGCCWYSEGIHSCSGITNLYDVDHGR